MSRTAFAAAAAVALCFAVAGASAADRTLKLQTSQNAGDFTFTYLSEVWAPKVEAMSGGSIALELLPTRAVVPHRETIDAVGAGILQGDLNAVSYFTGRDPAFAILGDLIAGYDTPDQVQTFCSQGGGKEALQEVYDSILPNQIHVVGCSPYTKEALVSTLPINGVADLEGVKIRAPEGLASEVFRRAGATPVAIPFSEVYTSLDKGIVEAADASALVNNDATGMHRIAKYPLYPGIHSMAVLQFIVNKQTWDALTDAERTILETWYLAAYTDLRRHADRKDRELAAAFDKGDDVTIIDWPQAERDKFRAIATEAWTDYAAQSPLAQKALDAHLAFMRSMNMLQ